MLSNNLMKLRKEKKVTQEVLAEYLSVSRQTISNWESGITTPNIEQLTKLSNYYNVSVDELLNDLDSKKSNNNYYLLYLILFILIIFIFLLIFKTKKDKQSSKFMNEYECRMTRTYHVIDVNDSNDENYFYITINEYQNEGVYTIKIPRFYAKEISKDNNYEFTFNTNHENINNNPNLIFKTSELINIVKTEKIGMEQKNEFICK